MRSANLTRTLLLALIVTLSISALLAVVLFLGGGGGDTEAKLLATTSLFAFFSLTGLVSAILLDRQRFPGIGIAGMVASAAGAALSFVLVWSANSYSWSHDVLGRWTFAAGISAVALAWTALSLLSSGRYRATGMVVLGTVVIVLSLGVFLVVWILGDLDFPEEAGRLLGALGVLAVLGTLVAPILNKVFSLGESPDPGASASGPPRG